MNLLKRFGKALAGSKKAVASVSTAIFAVAGPALDKLNIGLHVTEGDVKKVVAIACAYLIGQGVADHGKEAEKIRQAAAAAAKAALSTLVDEKAK